MKKVALERYTKMKGNAPERLVSGSDDFTMFLWEPSVSKHPKTRLTGHQQLVNHVYFSPDGQWIASASFDKSVKLWNGITGKFVAAFRGHVGPVYQISWLADNRLLLSGSKDSTLKIRNIRTQKLKQELPGHADEVFAVDWSPVVFGNNYDDILWLSEIPKKCDDKKRSVFIALSSAGSAPVLHPAGSRSRKGLDLNKKSNKEERGYTKEALEISAKLLEVNPEHYTGWNYRKLAVQHFLNHQSEIEVDSESIHSVLNEELKVVENALKKNFKSYGAWYHRKWVLSKRHSSTDKELRLLGKFQKLDSRNFHAWNYRRFITMLKKISDEEELQYTTDMIYDNFSNYSAWHNRSVLLSHLFEKRGERQSHKESVLEEEFEFVRNALFTDPDDQSGWFYHLWLLDQTACISSLKIECFHSYYISTNQLKDCPVKIFVAQFPGIVSSSGFSCSLSSHIEFSLCVPSHDREHAEGQTIPRFSWKDKIFCSDGIQSQDASLLHSLHQLKITEEGKSKAASDWSMKTIANEIIHCRELLSSTNCKIGKLTLARLLMAQNQLISYGIPNDGIEVHYKEILGLYHDLMKLDPVHICYYEDEYSLVLLKQVTSSMESILRYCNQYGDSTSPSISQPQQNSIIEGLKVLQLLSCLNLSNNKICSFTALDPLRMLKSLKVLDISYNEIGPHSVDTRRYLCSSPMTHTVENDWNFEEFTNSGVELTNHWEAFFIFRGLNLIQLDIMGNAVVNDELKLFLFKLMPSLKWLDSENRN
ncbi:unnamed protein product [Fraxinus pennsylvanica]|uniref:Geranylgeranyl transferase type-2 subunit alpha n=1 Tax=Fraxinus pennsylvanica TaxID=56036 RepID=A0AAD2EAX9_9LAMI|nr:unnamed protein product [Fraxinus pennsylvanica]